MDTRLLTNVDFGVNVNSFILYVNRTGVYFDKDGNQWDTGLRKKEKEDVDNIINILERCSTFYICKQDKWLEQVDRRDIKDLLGFSKY